MKTKIIINDIEPKYFANVFRFILALPLMNVKIGKIEFPQTLTKENFGHSDEINLKSKMGNLTWEDIGNSLKNSVSIVVTCQDDVKVKDLELIRKLCDYEVEERPEEYTIIFWPKNRELL